MLFFADFHLSDVLLFLIWSMKMPKEFIQKKSKKREKKEKKSKPRKRDKNTGTQSKYTVQCSNECIWSVSSLPFSFMVHAPRVRPCQHNTHISTHDNTKYSICQIKL
jgi:hypothetical protein